MPSTTEVPNNNNPNQYDCTQFKEPLQSAFNNVNSAFDYMTKGDYQQSADHAMKAVNLFESVSISFITNSVMYG